MSIYAIATILKDLRQLLNSNPKPFNIKGGMVDIQAQLNLVDEGIFNNPDGKQKEINKIWESVANICQQRTTHTYTFAGLRNFFSTSNVLCGSGRDPFASLIYHAIADIENERARTGVVVNDAIKTAETELNDELLAKGRVTTENLEELIIFRISFNAILNMIPQAEETQIVSIINNIKKEIGDLPEEKRNKEVYANIIKENIFLGSHGRKIKNLSELLNTQQKRQALTVLEKEEDLKKLNEEECQALYDRIKRSLASPEVALNDLWTEEYQFSVRLFPPGPKIKEFPEGKCIVISKEIEQEEGKENEKDKKFFAYYLEKGEVKKALLTDESVPEVVKIHYDLLNNKRDFSEKKGELEKASSELPDDICKEKLRKEVSLLRRQRYRKQVKMNKNNRELAGDKKIAVERASYDAIVKTCYPNYHLNQKRYRTKELHRSALFRQITRFAKKVRLVLWRNGLLPLSPPPTPVFEQDKLNKKHAAIRERYHARLEQAELEQARLELEQEAAYPFRRKF